jgi:DNA-binding CsgD family transcriptional regulator/tetratricopeptide (TPR) repeat protein
VGREAELRLLGEAWAAVADGGRQLALIAADGGGGKSRVVIEAATSCAESGAAVLVGGCVADLGSPYQPFDGPVTALLSSAGIDAGLRDLLALVAGHPTAEGAAPGGREYRPRLYGSVVEALRAATAAAPLVLVLEDLHWAAPDGLQLLTYVVEHTADVPMLVLATHRISAPDRSPALLRALTGLYRLPGVQRLELPPLGVGDIADFLVNETGRPLATLHTAAQALHRHTGGNPFFLREVWRDLIAHGGWAALKSGMIGAPESVRDTLQVRLDALAPTSRHLLELAAVLGDEVSLGLLLAMDAETAAPAGAEAVLAGLDAAVDLRLLEPAAGPGGDYRFPHALARQAVLDLMPPSRLAHSHALAVEVLEQHPEVDRWVQQLAHHCAGARALGYGGRAVEYFVEAARLADQALAHDEAATLDEQAAALAEVADRRHELLLKAARSHFLAADFLRAMELDEGVFEHGGPRDRLAAAIGYEAASWHLGQWGHRAAELLTSALNGVDRDPSDPLYVRALSGLGRALAFSGAVTDAAVLAERAIELGRALGRDDLLADVLQAGLHIGTAPATSDLRLARAEELTELALRVGDLGHLGAVGYQRGSIGYLRGDRRMVDEAQAQMARTARTTGQLFWTYNADMFDYARAFMAGDLEAAYLAAQRQVEHGRTLSAPDRAEGPFAVETYMVRREAGRLEQVRPLITGAERPDEVWAPGLLALYTELGLADPTARVLRWLVNEGLDRYEAGSDWPATLAFLTEAALYLGDDVTAGLLRPRLAEYAGLNLAAGMFVAVFGSADRYLGSVDSLLRRRSASEELESAVAMDSRMEAPLHLAHSLAAQAAHLRRAGAASREVHEVADRARQTAEPLGLQRVLRAVETLAPSACGRPDGLTPREVDILRLLADGMSNRDIARNLVISESTAANHVRSIFVKTGATNRTQAARYAAARNLLP